MEDKTIQIDIKELSFITLNAESCYNNLKQLVQPIKDEHAYYTLVALSLISAYRHDPQVKIEDTKLYLYTETIKAIINKDEEYLKKINTMLHKEAE